MSAKNIITECINEIWQASDIRAELKDDSTKKIFELKKVIIEGVLDLRHLVIDRSIKFEKCIFQGEVVFGDCEFKRSVDWSNCVFSEAFSSGNMEESKAIFRKALICNGSVFNGSVNLIGVQCEDSGFFIGARFEQKVNFRGGYFGNSLKFEKAHFEGDLDLSWIHVEKNMKCKETRFHGNADFNNINVEGAAYFEDAKFTNRESEVNFQLATFGRYVKFENASVGGGLNFGNVQVEGAGFFKGAQFTHNEKEMNFKRSAFGQNLVFIDTVFEGGANFSSITCGGNSLFEAAEFKYEDEAADFSWSNFDRNLVFDDVKFYGGASFRGIRCNMGGNFKNSENYKTISFVGADFGESLNFENAKFYSQDKRVDFGLIHVADKLVLNMAEFDSETSFYNANINVLKLGKGKFPFKENKLELNDCKIRNFNENNSALQFVRNQKPGRFTREPFIQLEQYYQRVGDVAQAKNAYEQGRLALRERATGIDANKIEWSWLQNIVDFALKWLTMYGARTHRLLGVILVFIVFNMLLFAWPGSLIVADQSTSLCYYALAGDSKTLKDCPSEHFTKKLGVLFIYSIDLFIPLVDLQTAKKLEPAILLPHKAWTAIYIIFGWLLVPLFVASITGVVKRQ